MFDIPAADEPRDCKRTIERANVPGDDAQVRNTTCVQQVPDIVSKALPCRDEPLCSHIANAGSDHLGERQNEHVLSRAVSGPKATEQFRDQTLLCETPKDLDLSAPGMASHEVLDGELVKWKQGLLRIRHAVTETPQDARQDARQDDSGSQHSNSTDCKALLRECGQELAEAVSTLRQQMSPDSGTLRRAEAPPAVCPAISPITAPRPVRSPCTQHRFLSGPRPVVLEGAASPAIPSAPVVSAARASLQPAVPVGALREPALAAPCRPQSPLRVPSAVSLMRTGSAEQSLGRAHSTVPMVRPGGSTPTPPLPCRYEVPGAASWTPVASPLRVVGSGDDGLSRSVRLTPAPLLRGAGSCNAKMLLSSVSHPLTHATTACSPAPQIRVCGNF